MITIETTIKLIIPTKDGKDVIAEVDNNTARDLYNKLKDIFDKHPKVYPITDVPITPFDLNRYQPNPNEMIPWCFTSCSENTK